LVEHLKNYGRNIALQGELIGEGIQGNPYRLRGQEFYLFDIYDIDAAEYLDPVSRERVAAELSVLSVPLILRDSTLGSVDNLLLRAEGKSQFNPHAEREGIVYKCVQNPRLHFKAISNRFLLKTGG